LRAAAPEVTLPRVWIFRRKPRERPFDEATAYARLHGDRDELVRIVELPPRRKRYRDLLASGEQIRRGFERKLDEREPEPEAEAD
jgi:hypothetical protein